MCQLAYTHDTLDQLPEYSIIVDRDHPHRHAVASGSGDWRLAGRDRWWFSAADLLRDYPGPWLVVYAGPHPHDISEVCHAHQ